MRGKLVTGSVIHIVTVLTILVMLLGCGAKVSSDGTENTPPIIKDVIVPDQVVVELKVHGHDADGDKLRYQWKVDQGELDSKTKRTVKWSLPSDAKSATFTVFISDGVNESVPLTKTIKINLKNVAPVIKRIVVPESVIAGERIQLEAETYDPDGDSVAFNWNVEVGGLSSSTSETPIWTAPIEGTVVQVELSVDDGINEPTVKSATIKIAKPPLIIAGKQAAGVRLGDSFDKVIAVYGTLERPIDDIGVFRYHDVGIIGFVDSLNLVLSLFIYKPNKSITSGGVGIGSNRQRVEAEFGSAEEIEIKEDDNRRVHSYWQKGIIFHYDKDSQVESIHVIKPLRWR